MKKYMDLGYISDKTIADFVRQSPYNKKLVEAELKEFANRKNNKLIAEFMGMKLGDDKTMYYDDAENLHPPTPINELKFHSSWDWLMPVTEKCLITDEPTDGQHYFINDALLTCNIDVVYDRVAEFIKEHNKTI